MQIVLFQTIQFSISKQFSCQKHFHFKLFKQLYITIQFSVSTVSTSKTVQFQIIQFSISTQFKCKFSLIVKNISISSYSQFSMSTDFLYTQLNVKTVAHRFCLDFCRLFNAKSIFM